MAKSLVLPRVHVLLLCDDIEQQWDEGPTVDLLRVRLHLTAPFFPHHIPQLWVYMQVTGHEGVANGRVGILRATGDEEVFATPDEPVVFFGPLEYVEVRTVIADCVFPDSGIYYLQVFFDGVLRGERIVEVLLASE